MTWSAVFANPETPTPPAPMMGLRGWIAGMLAFGITLGLAIVYVIANGVTLDDVPVLTWGAWAAAIVVTGLMMSRGWTLFLVAASALLLVATVPVLDGDLWLLPMVGSVSVLLLTRFSGVNMMSQWGAKAVGVAGLAMAAWPFVMGTPAGDDRWLLVGLAVGLAVLGLYPRGGFGGGDEGQD